MLEDRWWPMQSCCPPVKRYAWNFKFTTASVSKQLYAQIRSLFYQFWFLLEGEQITITTVSLLDSTSFPGSSPSRPLERERDGLDGEDPGNEVDLDSLWSRNWRELGNGPVIAHSWRNINLVKHTLPCLHAKVFFRAIWTGRHIGRVSRKSGSSIKRGFPSSFP